MAFCIIVITLITGTVGYFFADVKMDQQRKLFLRQKLSDLESQIHEAGVHLCILQSHNSSSAIPEGNMICLLDFWEKDFEIEQKNLNKIKDIINKYVKLQNVDQQTRAIVYLDADGFDLEDTLNGRVDMKVDMSDSEYYSVIKIYNQRLETELWQAFEYGLSFMKIEDVQNWDVLMDVLNKQESEPVNRVWVFLNQDCKQIIENWAVGIPLDDKSKATMINGLNQIIKNGDFYDFQVFAQLKKTPECEKLITDGLDDITQIQVQRLNRLLIDAVFPDVVDEPESYPNLGKKDLKMKIVSNVTFDVTTAKVNVQKQYFYARFNEVGIKKIQEVRKIFKKVAKFDLTRGDKIYFYNLQKNEFRLVENIVKVLMEHTGTKHIILYDEIILK